MLHDRRRLLWPVAAMMAPLVVALALCVISRSKDYMPFVYVYFYIMSAGLLIYLVHGLWRYSRWLRDNYADLEHKEIWQSCLVLGFIMITFGIYVGGLDWKAYETVIQICDLIIVCFVVWRVETISDLSNMESDSADMEEEESSEEETDTSFLEAAYERIGPMLQRRCIDTQLYLQHDLTLAQLAKAIGTNRYYLSQYFSSQGTTYNAYINTLRINHFVELYRDAIANYSPFTVQQLANDSGYRSYSTFSVAFKQRMGQNVTAWTKKEEA
jgi:AraC-like DNA-binding protein